MPCFDNEFIKAKDGAVYYKGLKLVRLDRFPVENGDTLVLSIEKTVKGSRYLQGFCIDVTGHAEVNGEIFKKKKHVGVRFWEDSTPQQQKIRVFTKTGSVAIYNICESDVTYLTNDDMGNPRAGSSKSVDCWIGGAAMIVEEIPNGRRYRCSDVSCVDKKDQFSDIVFIVQRLKE